MPEQGSVAAAVRAPAGSTALTSEPAGQLYPARLAELIAPLSSAFDLAEEQSPGHSTQVAHVAVEVAARLGLDAATRRTIVYAGLLHDSGVAVGELPHGVDVTGGHTAAGAWVAARFGLDDRIQNAIRCSHERWDGGGRPQGLAKAEIPLESLIVSAAHWATDVALGEESPLRARARLQCVSVDDVAPIVSGEVAAALSATLSDDATWMVLWDDQLPEIVARAAGGEGQASVENVERVAEATGEVLDAALREPGRARRVAGLAFELARLAGLAEQERRAVRVAGHLIDIGQLGIPRYINEKPAILSVEEMERVSHHPGWGARIIEQVPGLEQITRWVEAHHEQPDGRGYSEMLSGDEIPLPARILAIADNYWALRAERPHREAFSRPEALSIIDGGAGSKFDVGLVELLRPALEACHAAS